jgi:glycerol-3-phosphate cytidylyltransferase
MKVGVIAGNFDVIHPGYIKMFTECKANCDQFIVLLHADPSLERPHKLKPILSIEERTEMLYSLKMIDDVITYTHEASLYAFLAGFQPDVRFLGDDYKGKSFTGDDLPIAIHYINRDHGWSTTKFKKLIADEVQRSSNI